MRDRTQKAFEWRTRRCWAYFAKQTLKRTEVQRLLRKFDTFVAFHACRSMSVEPYYRDGLTIADHDSLTAVARKIFLTNEFPEITCAEFEMITSKISRIDHQRTHAVLDDDELIRWCGHYLIYGSEHIGGIAAALMKNGRRDYRQILKRFGTPTIFRLELPRDFIPAEQIEQLGEYLGEMSEDFVGRDEPPHLSWSFIFSKAVPAEYVISHAHPEVVPDPLLRYLPYRYREDGDWYECL
jgi:hypothetical protein